MKTTTRPAPPVPRGPTTADSSSLRASRLLLIGAVAVPVLAWASAFVVIRGVTPFVGGGALALGRLAVGAVVLGILVLAHRRWVRPSGRDWLRLIVYGVGWFGAYNVALNLAEHTLDAGTAALIVGIGPILIALGAGLFLGEGIPRWLAIGAGVAFLGVILIGVGTSLASGGDRPIDPIGVLWAVLAAVVYAIGVLAQKPMAGRLPASQITLIGCVIGLIACLPFTAQLIDELAAAPTSAWLGVLYLGVVPTALAFTAWGYALGRMPAGQLGVTTYIVPPLAVVMGLLFFAEVPAPLAIVGGVLSLAGVAVSRRTTRVHVPAQNLPE